MNKKGIFIIVILFTVMAYWFFKNFQGIPVSVEKNQNNTQATKAVTPVNSYWTCPMHPQIHSDHPGECPICHMKLVLVKEKPEAQTNKPEEEKRGSIQVTASQLALTGVQKTEIERMTLRVKIPFSGRFLSSSSVAFQLYESDLRYIKAGLTFRGTSSFYPDKEMVGTISSVDSIVDPTSRTVRVVGVIKQGSSGTPSETGFRGDVEFELKDRVAIPESSVLHTGSGDFVYVFIKDHELAPKKVALGLKTEGFYDVLGGVEAGEVISSGPNFLIDSESKMRALFAPEVNETGELQKPSQPKCPKGEHWDIPMSMCMPGEG